MIENWQKKINWKEISEESRKFRQKKIEGLRKKGKLNCCERAFLREWEKKYGR